MSPQVRVYGILSVPDMLRGREGKGENIGYVLQDKMRVAAAWQTGTRRRNDSTSVKILE